MQQPANPYQTPMAPVADQGPQEFSEVKIFSAAGRMGRVRYIGYSVGLTLVFYALIGLGAGLAAASGLAGGALVVAAVIGLLVVTVLLTIQRCHDFDVSGWLSLILIVPAAPLLFWIIPGSKGPNRFGNPPPPNSTAAVVLALILPTVFVVGIIAAIAIPAYQSYSERARMVKELREQGEAQEEAMKEAEKEDGDEGSANEPPQSEPAQPAKGD